jgi:hypothetical protein
MDPIKETISNGKWIYKTVVTRSGRSRYVTVTCDLNHPEIQAMIDAAVSSEYRKSVRANGALKVEVV